MKIRDLPLPETPTDIARALAALSPEVLVQVVKEKSQAMDVRTLRTMTQGGMLELEDFDRNARAWLLGPDYGLLAMWSERVQAFCAFAHNATLEDRTTTVAELQSVTYAIPVLKATDAFKDWFEEATQALAEAWTQITDGCTDATGKEAALVAVAQWAACAAMLDLPRALDVLHAACPRSIFVTFPLGSLLTWQTAQRVIHPDSVRLEVSATWFAWQFSSLRCLQESLDEAAVVGRCAKGTSTDADDKDLTVLAGLVRSDVQWRCDNSTFVHAIRVVMQSDAPQHAMREAAMGLIKRHKSSSQPSHRIEAYRDAGFYALYPALTACAACASGLPSLIDAVKDHLVADAIETKVIYDALSDHRVGQDLRAEAVLRLVLSIHQNFGVHAASNLFWGTKDPSRQRSAPIVHVFDKNLDKMLVAFMDAGIVKPHVARPGQSTPMDIARGMNSDMVGVMASWLARHSAHALLDEMDRSPFLVSA